MPLKPAKKEVPAVHKKMAELAKTRAKIRKLREEYPEVFEEYDQLAKDESDLVAAVKKFVNEEYTNIAENGEVLRYGGIRVEATIGRVIDVEKLMQQYPNLPKVAKLSYTLRQDEAMRLVAAKVVKEAHINACTTYQPRLTVKDE